MHVFGHVTLHALEETAKLIPFLFLTYLLLELIEHRAAKQTAALTARSGAWGPLMGGLLGALPQCGFSASASGLYAGGVISMGTLVAVFLSTSDEMLPVMIAGRTSPARILSILGVKVVCGILVGFAVDLALRMTRHSPRGDKVRELCEDENCGCAEKGIWLSSLFHTLQIAFFIFLFSFFLGAVVEIVGEETLAALASGAGVFTTLVCALIGLIPNCASSVILTELFLGGVISTGALLAGLLSGSGVGLLILFRLNKNVKQNAAVLACVFGAGVTIGIFADLIGIIL